MLTSINPLGQRARGQRWGAIVALYTAASVVGGLTTAALVGGLGSVTGLAAGLPRWIAVVGCVLAAALDAVRRVPSGRRQVDEDWLTRYRSWVYATGFGWQLGTGVVTIVTSASIYAWLLLMLLLGLPGALLPGAAFGVMRALPLCFGHSAETPQALRSLARRLEAGRSWAQGVTVLALLLSGAALALGMAT